MEYNIIKKAADYVKDKIGPEPEIGMILGSGLGFLGDEVDNPIFIEYSEIPGFPVSTVKGHKGRFVIGTFMGRQVIIMQGRFHYYEGWEMKEIIMPVRLMKLIGVKKLIVTNAAGGINFDFAPGDLMIIEDHINFLGINALRGKNIDEFGTRFPDMSFGYSEDIRGKIENAAAAADVDIKKGVYSMVSGPSFETPAEIKMLRALGADAVGMSTVPEVVAANHCGIEVAGISLITNMAAGILKQVLTHEEVMETAEMAKDKFAELIRKLLIIL